MSRSYKIPILKDKPRNYKRTTAYWRKIRRIWKYTIKSFGDHDDKRGRFGYLEFDDSLPNPKTIINEYDYCDYYWDFRNSWHDEEDKIKYSRK